MIRVDVDIRYVWTGRRCQCGQPCGYVENLAHVAAVLAEADLLVERDRERDVYRNRPQQEACDRRVREAERRGAVAALLNLWPSMVEFVRASGRAQVLIAKDAQITEKHLSRMLNHREGSLDMWQRVLHAAAADRLTEGDDRG